MKYTIEIDDRSNVKKGIIEMLKEFSKKHKGIHIRKLNKKELEAREDEVLLDMMMKARKEGLANTDEVLRELGIK